MRLRRSPCRLPLLAGSDATTIVDEGLCVAITRGAVAHCGANIFRKRLGANDVLPQRPLVVAVLSDVPILYLVPSLLNQQVKDVRTNVGAYRKVHSTDHGLPLQARQFLFFLMARAVSLATNTFELAIGNYEKVFVNP